MLSSADKARLDDSDDDDPNFVDTQLTRPCPSIHDAIPLDQNYLNVNSPVNKNSRFGAFNLKE